MLLDRWRRPPAWGSFCPRPRRLLLGFASVASMGPRRSVLHRRRACRLARSPVRNSLVLLSLALSSLALSRADLSKPDLSSTVLKLSLGQVNSLAIAQAQRLDIALNPRLRTNHRRVRSLLRARAALSLVARRRARLRRAIRAAILALPTVLGRTHRTHRLPISRELVEAPVRVNISRVRHTTGRLHQFGRRRTTPGICLNGWPSIRICR